MDHVICLSSGSLDGKNRFTVVCGSDYILTERGYEILYDLMQEMESRGLAEMNTQLKIK